MYAIIETGGKQYKVEQGDQLQVELLDMEIGKTFEMKDLLDGAMVTVKVMEHGKGEKLNIFKYKPKKRIRKRMGHRQPFTLIEVMTIKGGAK